MRAYIVAFISSFDSELKQYYILAKSRVEALLKFLETRGIIIYNCPTEAEIIEQVHNMDCQISVFKL